MTIPHSDDAFDVYRNAGRHQATIPFVVIVQSSVYDDYRRRVVVPLVRKDALGPIAEPALNPTFFVEGIAVVLHPLEIVSIPCGQLGDRVGSLSDAGDEIIRALDQLLGRTAG
jgi:toxin CcdB